MGMVDSMKLFDYIDKYGDYSFLEKDFNEVDNVILSSLSYLDLSDIVVGKGKIKISDVYVKYSANANEKSTNIISVDNAIDVLKRIYNKKRYCDILMYNYVYIGDDSQQFCAVSLDIGNDLVYVSFEGTDELISGWREDFEMAYKFPVKSQKQAVEYVNKCFTFSGKKLILGGHSKGGNLAMVSSMYCNFVVRKRIVNIYNNDGPGLRKEQLYSKKYSNIKDRLIHIIPNYSIVGLILGHSDDYVVIKSSKKSVLSHSIVTWEVDDNCFVRGNLCLFGKSFEVCLNEWLSRYSDVEKKFFVDSLFDIFEKVKVNTIIDIYENKRLIFELIKESNNIDDVVRAMIEELVEIVIKYLSVYGREKVISIFD